MGFAAVKVDNKVQQYRQEIFDSGVAARLGCQPDEVFVLPVYNEEETEIVNEYGPMIWEYSNEARNLFVTGELDLDKDRPERVHRRLADLLRPHAGRLTGQCPAPLAAAGSGDVPEGHRLKPSGTANPQASLRIEGRAVPGATSYRRAG